MDLTSRAIGGETPSVERFWTRSSTRSLIAAILVAILSGLIAGGLNGWLMQRQQPVFDSLSYLDRMHRVMSLAVRDGPVAGLEIAVLQNTVCLPYLVALTLAPFVEPARWIGTAIQAVGLGIFLIGLDRLLILASVRRVSSRILAMVAVNMLAVMLFTNGGLGDFRMDFSLMLGYGTTMTALSMAVRTGTWQMWVWTGVAAAGTCLTRGTAPVYLLLAAGPVCLFHLWQQRIGPWRRMVRGMLLAFLTTAILAGWFYVLNVEYLKYYYLEWNTDANAQMPLSESIRHLQMVGRQAGIPAMVAVVLLGVQFRFWKGRGESSEPESRDEYRHLVWEAVWFAALPLGILVAGGAGLNPFVSMPSIISLYIVGALMLARQTDAIEFRRAIVVWVIVLLGIGGAIGRGIKKHGWPKEQYMMAHQIAIDSMLEDNKKSGAQHIRFGSLALNGVHTDSLWSVVQFHRPDVVFEGQNAFVDQVRLEPIRLFMLPAEVNWSEVPGETDVEKYEWLVSRVPVELDYLVLPDEVTAQIIHGLPATDVINRHLPELRRRILTENNLVPLAECNSPVNAEKFVLYRVVR